MDEGFRDRTAFIRGAKDIAKEVKKHATKKMGKGVDRMQDEYTKRTYTRFEEDDDDEDYQPQDGYYRGEPSVDDEGASSDATEGHDEDDEIYEGEYQGIPRNDSLKGGDHVTANQQVVSEFRDFADLEADKKKEKEELSQQYELILQECGHGRFQWTLYFVLGLALMADGVEIFVVGFVLPSAEKDMCLSDSNKGMLGPEACGSAGDTLGLPWLPMTLPEAASSDGGGRLGSPAEKEPPSPPPADLQLEIFKQEMVVGFNWFSELRKKLATEQPAMSNQSEASWARKSDGSKAESVTHPDEKRTTGLTCPSLSCSIGGSIPIVFSYYSEFLAQEKRGEHLSWLCMFWMIGGIYASAMAWAIIPHYGWSFQMGSAYQFHSWRVFVLVCAFPSVFAIGALSTMPESPRFFLENGKHDEAWMVLKQVHDTNMRAKGHPERVFSVTHIKTIKQEDELVEIQSDRGDPVAGSWMVRYTNLSVSSVEAEREHQKPPALAIISHWDFLVAADRSTSLRLEG
ncbi:synaptic vesicle glycoprotein 2A-like [Sphaerodactylus townsendi]|uniref:synaptic vesicle glycoprotein 2A-like n=1 Tax=Sphaerodactylus townsendi TaxID=933632 RepID=UPI00202614A4|nr:synaptic vesicle glycoprotein 2A-like [Sphaerodactylus townsendi]